MKKMSNRFLSVIIALVMVMSMFGVAVSADDAQNAEFSISVAGNVAVGEEITVLIAIKNAKEVDSASMSVQYDSECMEFVDLIVTDAHNYVVVGNETSKGVCKCGIMFSDAFSGDFSVATLILKVLSVENTDITLSAEEWTADETGPADAVFSLIDMETDDSLITRLYYKYKIENGEVTITDCDRNMRGDVVIPDTIEGYPVTVIGDGAFYNCDKITSIVVPDSVKTIEKSAFDCCDGLLSATIGSGVTTLGCGIFYHCKNLENVVIKEGVTCISQEMFSQCWKLKTVSIPESVTSIGESAFAYCYLLKNIVIPESVAEIASAAFYHCENLESINIPENVTVINSSTFSGCKKLSNIQLNNNITEIGSYAFSGCAIKEINIPDGIKAISEGTFSGCSYLSEVTIPESVNTIGMYAFFGCTSLKNITVPLSVENIYYKSLGFIDEMHRVNEFYLYGFEGSATEKYAQSNLVNFVPIEYEEPSTDEPITDGPANVLTPNADSNITVTDTIANLVPEMSVEDIIKSVENENVQIVDKDGKELTKDSFVGTGSKIQILDKDGNVLSEYEVMVKSDVDGNEKITPADARLALRASANLDKLEGVYETAANYDGKDNVSTSDARMILRKAAGLEK